jgi:hypothetical protein
MDSHEQSYYFENSQQLADSTPLLYGTKDERYFETDQWTEGKEEELFDLKVGFDASFSLDQKQTKKRSAKIRSKNIREIIPPPSPVPLRKNPHEVLTAGMPSLKTSSPKEGEGEDEHAGVSFLRKTLGFSFPSPQQAHQSTSDVLSLGEESKEDKEDSLTLPPLSIAGRKQEKNADPVQSLLETIHTVDEAIQYFAQHRSQTPIKFIKLVPNPHLKPQDFNPYDLIVLHTDPIETQTLSSHQTSTKHNLTGEEEREHHSYIMTAGSIVHSDPDFQDESLSLGEWVRASRLFSVIRKINYFKLYLYRKMFDTWRANVRFKQFKRQQKRVRDHLFLANPSFASTIVSLHTSMLEVSSVNAFSMESHKAHPLDVFSEEQKEQQEALGSHLETHTHQSIDEVYELAKFTVRIASSSDDPRDKHFI